MRDRKLAANGKGGMMTFGQADKCRVRKFGRALPDFHQARVRALPSIFST
jgi:hypothetical protein